MSYLWLQTVGGGTGDAIDPAHIPADRLAAARALIALALAEVPAGDAPIAYRPGYRLRAAAANRGLTVSILAPTGAALVTMVVAPRAITARKQWAAVERLAAGLVLPARPQAPWAIVVAYPALVEWHDPDDAAWLPMLEAEIAVAWLGMPA